jgi:hypothetical protein
MPVAFTNQAANKINICNAAKFVVIKHIALQNCLAPIISGIPQIDYLSFHKWDSINDVIQLFTLI